MKTPTLALILLVIVGVAGAARAGQAPAPASAPDIKPGTQEVVQEIIEFVP